MAAPVMGRPRLWAKRVIAVLWRNFVKNYRLARSANPSWRKCSARSASMRQPGGRAKNRIFGAALQARYAASRPECCPRGAGGVLATRPLHVPLGEFAAPACRVKTHYEAVVIDLLHRAARPRQVPAAAHGYRDVAVDGDRTVTGVIGALLVPGRGAGVLRLAQPRPDHRITAGYRVVVGVVPVQHVCCEQFSDLIAVVTFPGLDVRPKPAVDLRSIHTSHLPTCLVFVPGKTR